MARKKTAEATRKPGRAKSRAPTTARGGARIAESPEEVAYLRSHGIDVPPSSLGRMVALAVARLPRTLGAPDPTEELTEAEVEALKRGGLDLKPADLGEEDPLAQTAADYAALLETGKTVGQAAKILGVNGSRIRQRLTAKPPTLYGLKVDSEWRIPAFLFDQNRLLPGIEEVVRALPPTIHPVGFYRWFTTPDPDLSSESISDEPLSPRDWLRLGLPPKTVAEIAADL